MTDHKLTNYIKQQTQQGIPHDTIVKDLVSKGWHPSDIDQAFSQLSVQDTQSPTDQSIVAANTVKNKNPLIGLWFGIIGLLAWIVPIIGAPITIAGLIFSIKGLKSLRRGLATAGIILSSVGLLATIVNAAIGAYQETTGQHAIVDQATAPDGNEELLSDDLDISLSTMPEALDELAELFIERYNEFEIIDIESDDYVSDNRGHDQTLFYSETYNTFVQKELLADEIWSVSVEKGVDPASLSHSEAQQNEDTPREMLDALREKVMRYQEVVESQFINSNFTKMNLMEEVLPQLQKDYRGGPVDIFYSIDTLTTDDVMCVINSIPAHWNWVGSGPLDSLREHDIDTLSRMSINVHCAPIAAIDTIAKRKQPFKEALNDYNENSTNASIDTLVFSVESVGFDALHYGDTHPYPWGDTPTSLEQRRYSEEVYNYARLDVGDLGPTGVSCGVYQKANGSWTTFHCGHGPPNCSEINDIDVQKAYYDQLCYIDNVTTSMIGEYWDI